MTIKECIESASNLFNKKYNDIKLSHLEAGILLTHTLNISKIDIINKANIEVENNKEKYFFSLVERRLNSEPIAYIVGKKEFYGKSFYVDSNVLIPRPETEELIELAIKYIKPKDKVIDIGTGSGIIAITVKDIIKDIEVLALDISTKAIEIAKRNALNILETNNNIEFIVANSINYTPAKKYDVLLSNPPYVSLKDKEILSSDLSYEPSLALFGGESGLDFYNAFLPMIDRYLKTGGKFIFEIGYNQGDALVSLCQKLGIENIAIKKDLSNNDRFLVCENFIIK